MAKYKDMIVKMSLLELLLAKVFIRYKNDSVGCIYDSTNFLDVRRQQFFANNRATINPLVVKMTASRNLHIILLELFLLYNILFIIIIL